MVGVRRFDSNRLRAILTLKGALTRRFVRLALRAASRSKSAVLPICRRPKRCAFCELPAPASRRHSVVFKQLFLIGMLETPVDTSA